MKILKFFGIKNKCVDIFYTLIENPSNIVIKELMALVNNCCSNNAIQIDRKMLSTSENCVLVCHAEPISEDTNKCNFLDPQLNTPSWWRLFKPKDENSIIYLFCCRGYNAIKWNILNYHNPSILTYTVDLGYTLNNKEITSMIESYFCRIRSEMKSEVDIEDIKIHISEAKKYMITSLEKEILKARKNKDSHKENILRYQLIYGFQNQFNQLVTT